MIIFLNNFVYVFLPGFVSFVCEDTEMQSEKEANKRKRRKMRREMKLKRKLEEDKPDNAGGDE